MDEPKPKKRNRYVGREAPLTVHRCCDCGAITPDHRCHTCLAKWRLKHHVIMTHEQDA